MSERIYLFPKENTFYKANLHCHTTVSDGMYTPEKTKEEYMQRGYSVIAFSDHEKMVPHPELQAGDFVALTAAEISVDKKGTQWPNTQTYHINLIAETPNKTTYPTSGVHPHDRGYSVESVSALLGEARSEGFLTTINHPRWSMQDSNAICGLENLTYFEIYNHQCQSDLFNGDGEYEYELFLRAGGKSGVAACDDNHISRGYFGGFTMISAPTLSYDNIINSLKNGDMYASNGPEIYELYIEDNSLYIKCSPVERIGVFTEARNNARVFSNDGTDSLTEAVLPLDFVHEYIRVVLCDTRGHRAWTRAYFEV